MPSLNRLQVVIVVIGILAAAGPFLLRINLELGRLWFVVSVASFLVLTLVVMLVAARRRANHLGFPHILVLMTAASWVGYSLTDIQAHADMAAEQLTFLQNLVGLWTLLAVAALSTQRMSPWSNEWGNFLRRRIATLPFSSIQLCILIFTALVFYRFSVGLVMSGTGLLMKDVTALQSVVLQISAILEGMVGLLAWFLYYGRSRRRHLLGLTLLIIQFVLCFLQGRRILLGFLLLGWLNSAWFRGFDLRRVLIAGAVVAVIMLVGGALFWNFRNVAISNAIHTSDAAARGTILAHSWSTVIGDLSWERLFSPEYSENVSQRSGFLTWTVAIQERLSQGVPLRGGEIILQTLMEYVPRVLFPEKLEWLGDLRIEQKIQVWFRILDADTDGSSTVLGFAIADGGWVGVLLYFAGYGWLLGMLFRFSVKAHSTWAALWAAATLYNLCYSLESGVTELVGSLRMLIVVASFDWVVNQCDGRRQRSLVARKTEFFHYPQLTMKDGRLGDGPI